MTFNFGKLVTSKVLAKASICSTCISFMSRKDIKNGGCKLFELDEQGKLYLFCLLGNMYVAFEVQY